MRTDLAPKESPKPCHVYLLVHRYEPRFKIGVSIDPDSRMNSLPEYLEIDEEQSLSLCLSSQKRAFGIERILHKALEDFRLHIRGKVAKTWPGGTEWFHLEGFLHAVQLLEHVPTGRTQETLRLQRLDGSEIDKHLYIWRAKSSEKTLRAERAARQNVIQIRKILAFLATVGKHCRLFWRPFAQASVDALGRHQSAQSERVVVMGLAELWEPGAIGPRFALSLSETWMFQTGKGQKSGEQQSLLTIIRFSAEQPKDLEFELIDRQNILRWPAGVLILRIWDEWLGR